MTRRIKHTKRCNVVAYERKRYSPNKPKLEYCPESNSMNRLTVRCYDTKKEADAICRPINKGL
jgi:hypothetical protein